MASNYFGMVLYLRLTRFNERGVSATVHSVRSLAWRARRSSASLRRLRTPAESGLTENQAVFWA
jgi:hypothetical protein